MYPVIDVIRPRRPLSSSCFAQSVSRDQFQPCATATSRPAARAASRDRPRVGERQRHGLLDEHVRTRLEGRDRVLAVEVVRRGDDDAVDARPRAARPPSSSRASSPNSFAERVEPGVVLADRAHELDLGMVAVEGEVLVGGPEAGADHPDPGRAHDLASVAVRDGCSSASLGQPRHLAAGEPAGRVVPRLGLGEEALGEPDARLDEDPLDGRVEERRQADALVPVAGLVPSVLVLVRRRQVAEDLVRVAGVERRHARRALLDGDAVLGERLAGPGDDDAVADANRVHRPAHLRRRSAVAELRLDPTGPRRLVVGELDAAAVARGAGLFERLVVLAALTLDLLERRVRQQRDGDGLARGRECRRLAALDELPAVAGDRRHRALLLRDDADLAAEPVGDRLQRRETEPRPHPARLVLGVREGELRQHVPACALEEDALAARDGAHDVAHAGPGSPPSRRPCRSPS